MPLDSSVLKRIKTYMNLKEMLIFILPFGDFFDIHTIKYTLASSLHSP